MKKIGLIRGTTIKINLLLMLMRPRKNVRVHGGKYYIHFLLDGMRSSFLQ
jgi:hypothetical protein